MVETFGTEKVPAEQLILLVRRFFDLRPYGSSDAGSAAPIYKAAAYGHFGRETSHGKNRQKRNCCAMLRRLEIIARA